MTLVGVAKIKKTLPQCLWDKCASMAQVYSAVAHFFACHQLLSQLQNWIVIVKVLKKTGLTNKVVWIKFSVATWWHDCWDCPIHNSLQEIVMGVFIGNILKHSEQCFQKSADLCGVATLLMALFGCYLDNQLFKPKIFTASPFCCMMPTSC